MDPRGQADHLDFERCVIPPHLTDCLYFLYSGLGSDVRCGLPAVCLDSVAK